MESLDPSMLALTQSRAPLLIGVRHHSAALSRAVPEMLDAFAPQCLLVELPSDLADWIEHLADPQTMAPVAISAVHDQHGLFFYPMADFSPEWVAIRWARQRGIPVVPCDLSVAAKTPLSNLESSESDAQWEQAPTTLLDRLLHRTGESDTGGLWQRLVESPGFEAEPDAIRAAALVFGYAVRHSTPDISSRDLVREAAMREAIRMAPKHSAAVIGSFHAAALLPEVVRSQEQHDAAILAAAIAESSDGVGVSLVPYSFEQLDERSGYPAGVRDPVWHQRMWESRTCLDADAAAAELVTAVCRRLRQDGHVAGMPDAAESLRMMRDLARLRGLRVAGRGELVEAIQTCLVQGDLMGRGRAVAKAAGEILIGDRIGTVTPAAPRCGLAVDIDRQLDALKLPGRDSFGGQSRSTRRAASGAPARVDEDAKEIQLDVLRRPRDRARAVVLRQLNAAGIPYAERIDEVERGHRENLIERWRVGWQQGTAATIESVSRYGVSLRQVVEGLVRTAGRIPGQDFSDTDDLPATILGRLRIATECGLVGLTRRTLTQISDSFRAAAGLSELVTAVTIITRIRAGHLPGLPPDIAAAYPPWVEVFIWPHSVDTITACLEAGLERLAGMSGSQAPQDVTAIVDLIDWMTGDLQAAVMSDLSEPASESGRVRLTQWCRQTMRSGSDRMRGAGAAALCMLDEQSDAAFVALTRGWLDSATDREGRTRLKDSLAGATQVLLPRMQSDPLWLGGIGDGIEHMSDEVFLSRLPSLRGAFAEFSPADRQRLLSVCLSELDERDTQLNASGSTLPFDQQGDPATIADELVLLRQADLAGRDAIEKRYPAIDQWLAKASTSNSKTPHTAQEPASDDTKARSTQRAASDFTTADRWRLVFGLPPDSNSATVSRCATSLDQLYGRGRGEGARAGLSGRPPGRGGGSEAPQPTTAQWADDLEALFGSDLCQEVLGAAAGAGRLAAIELLDPETVTPSIELLEQVLSLAGAMPESKIATLRRLARRITEDLAMQLAVRLQPALHGLSSPRPTRRKNRNLNLARTIRDNLANCHRRPDGRATIVAERLMFRSPAKRQMDWHVTFVVDVSGSMSASVIYSALVAAVLDALPALSVKFLAFSTEVLDFSEQVTDPLSLLMEVQVGGGTNIGLGLRAARAGISVPARSIVILVSDFEEGVSVGSMIAEVRALVDSGVACLGLAALDDLGVARYHQGFAAMMAGAGMPVAAVSPENLARWVGDQIRRAQTTS
ncbi:VWA domain containing CoxE-like protein [Allorhodopirellula heiligendammensis]|uniref:VWA domain containing CoxE-like protein n=2 Tax=Allorhodopirellula heiligendammensis TaxID=2714739 RepID=A0A5C6BUU6_9BACT|nr:DUF5682 family protein [Allorhodopirellula heiligendammensis]TWU16050.1 VWA domain containing CoxE-like protein [Allorhodopirellula heiligendammensis]